MSTDRNESNPYASPRASAAAHEPESGRFPWRIILVVVLYLYGGFILLLSGAILLPILVGESIFIDRNHFASETQLYVIMAGMILVGSQGCLAIAMGRNVWKQRWKQSVVFLAGAIVMVPMIVLTTLVVYRLPPGRCLDVRPEDSVRTNVGTTEQNP